MRTAMLAGIIALGLPLVAEAATYRLAYEGAATFDSYLNPDDPAERFPEVGSRTVNLSFALDFYIPEGDTTTQEVGFYDYGAISRGNASSTATQAFIQRFGGNFSDANLTFELTSNGELESASFRADDQDTSVFFADEETLTVVGYFDNTVFEGPGGYTLTNLDKPEIAPIPLPASAPLLLVGLSAIGRYRRRAIYPQ